MKKMGDIGKIITGNTPKTSDPKNYETRSICFVKPSDIAEDKITRILCSEFYISEYAREKARIVPPESVLVTCIGSIGKVAISGIECAINQQINAIIPDSSECNAEYLAYLLQYKKSELQLMANAPVVPILNKSQFSELSIELPSLDEQKIVNQRLNKITNIISLRQQQLAKLDELVKARFVEMFGDMLLNPMAWPEVVLETLADIVSGITKGRKVKEQTLLEVPYMAVSNVKDGYIDWTTVKTILATEQEIEQYRLFPDDVLMTEGGDPDKVGRGAIIKEPLENCIHQNHIFRVRLDKEKILPAFFAEYLQHQKSKRYFLGCAKQTTGIASINMKQLKALPVLLPPLDLQQQFDDFARQIERVRCSIQNCLGQMETLKKALIQQYFG